MSDPSALPDSEPAHASGPETNVLPHATVVRGSIYLSRELYERYLAGTDAIALLKRDGKLLLVPLIAQSAGGLLMKVRNRRGDRVVHAEEFFREHGIPEVFGERQIPVCWNANWAALELAGLDPNCPSL